MKSKLCISPIISVILILVVTTISVTSFLSWYSSYESNLNTKIESTVIDSNSLSIETIAGSVLYVKSNENTTIKSIKLDNNICSLDLNLTAGINEIDISTCLNNLTRSNPSVSLVSDNQVLSKNIYIKELNKYPTIQHGCTLDGISLEHGENYSFYQNIFSFNCSNEVSVLFCDNGVLEHSDTYKYHSCNTYNSCSIGGQTLEHNTSQIFYFKSFDEDGCINETRTCNNGVLNGSYTYTNCVENIATGGDEIYDINIEGINYRVHKFTTTGLSNFFILHPNGVNIEYLIIGGGGAGGNGGNGAGGGGGGGFVEGNFSFNSSLDFEIYVGLGGTDRQNGENSYINTSSDLIFEKIAIGGGAGSIGGGSAGQNGGSGGGGGIRVTGGQVYGDNQGGVSVQSSLGYGYGNSGGYGTVYTEWSSGPASGGGGGGAGSVGASGSADVPGYGGNGKTSSITGNLEWYSGGGAGRTASWRSSVISSGGSGGGGNSVSHGVSNTGGGGGGDWNDGGKNGGSGVVIIRYAIN